MKRFMGAVAAFAMCASLAMGGEEAANKDAAATTEVKPVGPFKTKKEQVSYALGYYFIANSIKRSGLEVDPELLTAAIKDGIAGKEAKFSEEEAKAIMDSLNQEMAKKQMDEMKTASAKNKAEGDAFLAKNKAADGVKTTPTGLQYKVLAEGTGECAKPTDTVKVNYKGTLIDGSVFDTSEGRGPAVFPLNRVIKGWTEGIQLMKVGAKFQFFIPASLAYGDESPTERIPPGSVLIFEVELLSIEPAK